MIQEKFDKYLAFIPELKLAVAVAFTWSYDFLFGVILPKFVSLKMIEEEVGIIVKLLTGIVVLVYGYLRCVKLFYEVKEKKLQTVKRKSNEKK